MLKFLHARHVLLCFFLILVGCGEQEEVIENPAGRSKVVAPRTLRQQAIDKQGMGTILIRDPTVYISTRLWRYAPEVLAYKRTIEIGSEHTNARMGLGAVYAKSVLNDLALEKYRKIAKENLGNADIHFKVALEYWYQQRIPQAIDYYQKTIAINPKHLQAHLNLASIYEQMKECNKALREITISRKLDKETQPSSRIHC